MATARTRMTANRTAPSAATAGRRSVFSGQDPVVRGVSWVWNTYYTSYNMQYKCVQPLLYNILHKCTLPQHYHANRKVNHSMCGFTTLPVFRKATTTSQRGTQPFTVEINRCPSNLTAAVKCTCPQSVVHTHTLTPSTHAWGSLACYIDHPMQSLFSGTFWLVWLG